MRRRISIATAALLLVVGTAIARAVAAGAASTAEGGTVTGVVSYAGRPSARISVEINKDKEVCGAKAHFNESLIVSPTGGIKNAVVVVKGAPGAIKPASVTFDQKDCDYVPHVLAFPAGSTVAIFNSDGILHTVHALRGEHTVFDKAQPGFKKKISAAVPKSGVIRILCDDHGWMEGWWYVTDTPYYAVSDAAGKFTINDVPPGTWTLEVWQEKLGTLERKVEVRTGASVSADFTFKPR
jgi:plastocyanin